MHQYIHGPALACHFPWLENMHNKMPSMPKPFYSLDRVSSRRCLWWPSHATDWPTRNRKYGWPDSATVDRVVTGGCDVVPVAHHLCRQDEWMSKHQWRLSFSRAEVVLPKQQIVFHMLRFYVKTERLPETGDNGGSTLSNYRIKTLMLWACELRPRSWWTDDNNLVEICGELLHILSVWLTDIRCKHNFISNCNLFDGTDNPRSIQLTGNHLRSLTSQSLAKWYINNYIRRCADGIRYLGAEVSRLFDDISTSAKIQRAVSAVVDWRHVYKTVLFSKNLHSAQTLIMHVVCRDSLTVRSTCLWMTELAKFDHSLPVYFVGVVFLHVASKTTRDSLTDELLDVLATIYRLARQTLTTDKDLKRLYESIQLFIGDVLGLTSVRREQNVRYEVYDCATPMRPLTELNKSELVELLQQSAVEHLTTCNQLQARDHNRLAYVGIRDFEALYAYKRGEYQHCLQLSALNILTLFDNHIDGGLKLPPRDTLGLLIYPEIIQLMEDDIVSLIGLAMIINPTHRVKNGTAAISQQSLLLYLMTQCQIKLGHSLNRTYDYVKVTARHLDWFRIPVSLDKVLIKLIERKIQYITT